MVHEDRRDFEMKVYSEKSALMQGRTLRPAGYFLLIVVLALSAIPFPAAHATAPQQKTKEANDRLDRDAKKAMRGGKYEEALKV